MSCNVSPGSEQWAGFTVPEDQCLVMSPGSEQCAGFIVPED